MNRKTTTITKKVCQNCHRFPPSVALDVVLYLVGFFNYNPPVGNSLVNLSRSNSTQMLCNAQEENRGQSTPYFARSLLYVERARCTGSGCYAACVHCTPRSLLGALWKSWNLDESPPVSQKNFKHASDHVFETHFLQFDRFGACRMRVAKCASQHVFRASYGGPKNVLRVTGQIFYNFFEK